ncbi:hypothetical protein [Streptomyces sp. HC307]|uniref:hypothetical protein n=1 Tax=Streptomyces flavusporus TaxID=3385496 RepID=UPI0039173A01
MELSDLSPGRSCLAGDRRLVAHPADIKGGVRRAVVKIYHGRNSDHLATLWRITQEEVDRPHLKRTYGAGAVTGLLSGFERPLSERKIRTFTA